MRQGDRRADGVALIRRLDELRSRAQRRVVVCSGASEAGMDQPSTPPGACRTPTGALLRATSLCAALQLRGNLSLLQATPISLAR